jgi:cytochrome c
MFQLRFLALGAPIAAAAALLMVAPAPAQNANGQTLFNQRCKTCHTVNAGGANMVGPNLHGVVGRKAGTAKFAYSNAMKNSKQVWTKPVLDKYLAGPPKALPGTKMVISVSDAAQRKAIIDFLATQR